MHTDDSLRLGELARLLCDTHAGDDVQRTGGGREGRDGCCHFEIIFWRLFLPRPAAGAVTDGRARLLFLEWWAMMVDRGTCGEGGPETG
jgi:hypothetical protein